MPKGGKEKAGLGTPGPREQCGSGFWADILPLLLRLGAEKVATKNCPLAQTGKKVLKLLQLQVERLGEGSLGVPKLSDNDRSTPAKASDTSVPALIPAREG